MYSVLITGSRGWRDYKAITQALHSILAAHPDMELISGGADGADKLCEQWAREAGVPVRRFDPDWNKHGRCAGVVRNAEMVACGPAEAVAFWDGESRGTKDAITRCQNAHIPIQIVIRPCLMDSPKVASGGSS